MTDRPTNEEREAMIAGDRAGALEPDEAAELTLLADLLADPSTWAEPNAGLEDAIVRRSPTPSPAMTTAVTPSPPAQRRRGHSVGAGESLLRGQPPRPPWSRSRSRRSDGDRWWRREPRLPGRAQRNRSGARRARSADITETAAGFRVSLDARGLPRLQGGEYYQAWLKNAAGTLVPIGTFSSSDGHVTLWSGVSPKKFPTITVTIESPDNEQASSGRRVLVGEVRVT